MTGVQLVLGAGGERGWDWTIGCLLALEDHRGFDGRDAELIVGTSVGSLIGAYLRHGRTPEVLAEHVGGPPAAAVSSSRSAPADLAVSSYTGPVVDVRRRVGSLIARSLRRADDLPSVGDGLARRLGTRAWPQRRLMVVAWDLRAGGGSSSVTTRKTVSTSPPPSTPRAPYPDAIRRSVMAPSNWSTVRSGR